MAKKILIINSNINIKPLEPLLRNLTQQGILAIFLSSNTQTAKICKENCWPIKKILPKLNITRFFPGLLLLVAYPVNLLLLLPFGILVKKKQIKTIYCLGWLERVIFTPLAIIFKLKIFWVAMPDENKNELNFLLRPLSHWLASKAEAITFLTATSEKLASSKFRFKASHNISFGINLKQYQHQENIFSKLAETNQKKANKKFFTVGTATNLNSKQNLEIVFQAIRKCQNVIPNIQLIVIGDGPERKNLKWLTQKIGIDTVVWFVGEQQRLKKWLTNFNIYLVSSDQVCLSEINSLLQAGVSSLPIVFPNNLGLDSIIQNNQNGFGFDLDDNEALAQAIINLHKDSRLRRKYAEANQQLVENQYSLDTTVQEFIKIIN